MLEVEGLNVWRGATHVLKDVSFTVAAGELAAQLPHKGLDAAGLGGRRQVVL